MVQEAGTDETGAAVGDDSEGEGAAEGDGSGVADVAIVGAGVAGLACAIYTARAGLETVVVDGGPSILERNALLENVPGFPGGVDARRFLAGTREQAADAGCSFVEGRVIELDRGAGAYEATVALDDVGDREAEGDRDRVGNTETATATTTVRAERVVAASWSDASYLDGLGVGTAERGTKTFVRVDDGGRTGVEGVYAAGRIAGKPHQTVVAAGHGAEVGLAAIHDAAVPFYHDWVAPLGYFTDRGREVPPGCEEVDDAERTEREAAARERQRALLEDPPEPPRTHPSLREDEE